MAIVENKRTLSKLFYKISQIDLELWQLHRSCECFLKQKQNHRTVSMDCPVLYVCRAMGFILEIFSSYVYLHLPQAGLYNLDNGRVFLGETISAHNVLHKIEDCIYISI